VSQIPSNIQQFNQGLQIGNQGIAIASENQRAKLFASLQSTEIRQRGKIAQLQADTEAERLRTQVELQELQGESFREREASQERMQQVGIDAQSRENMLARKSDAIMFENRRRFELEIEDARRRRAAAIQAGLLDEAQVQDTRRKEAEFQLLREKKHAAIVQALQGAMTGRLSKEGMVGKLSEAFTAQGLADMAFRSNTSAQLKIGMEQGATAVATRSKEKPEKRGGIRIGDLTMGGLQVGPDVVPSAYDSYVIRGDNPELQGRPAAVREIITEMVNESKLNGTVPAAMMAEFKETLTDLLVQTTNIGLNANQASVFGVAFDDSEKGKAAQNLQKLRRMVTSDNMVGAVLQGIIDNAGNASKNGEALKSFFGDERLGVGSPGNAPRVKRLKEIMDELGDLGENIQRLNGAPLFDKETGQTSALGDERNPIIDVENFKPFDGLDLMPRMIAALEANLSAEEMKKLVGTIPDDLRKRVDLIIDGHSKDDIIRAVAAERRVPEREVEDFMRKDLTQEGAEIRERIEDLQRGILTDENSAFGIVSDILRRMGEEGLDIQGFESGNLLRELELEGLISE